MALAAAQPVRGACWPGPDRGATARAAIIAAVIPLLLLLVGAVLVATGWLLLRRLGPAARIGRIMASTPMVPVAEARALAEAGRPRYVGVTGRIDAEQEFEDEHHRPLVFRRTRLEARTGAGWSVIEDRREATVFELVDGMDRMGLDTDQLEAGLVVIVRGAEGTAADIPDRVPEAMPPETPIRLRIEQVSSLDHAVAMGVPAVDPQRGPVLMPGLGRPLILTTLDRDEAMRVIAVDHRSTTRLAAVALGAGFVSMAVGLGWSVVGALA